MLDRTRLFGIIIFCTFFILCFFSFGFVSKKDWDTQSLIQEQIELGLNTVPAYDFEVNPDLISKGELIIRRGYVKKRKNKISTFFVCTDCHNEDRDFANFKYNNPEKDAEYCKTNKKMYLPAGSFYGMINQSSYYNNDYIKKYGKLVEKAKHSLAESVQLCAKECSQGRYLNTEELNSVMAYLINKQVKLKDVFENEKEYNNYQNNSNKKEILASKVNQYRSHFYGNTDLNEIKLLKGNSSNGEWLYQKSCLTCHKNERVSFYGLDSDRLSKKDLIKKLNNSQNELLTIIRYGTTPIPGRKAYMPAYMNEKLSQQQVADLIAYLNEK